MQPFPVIDADGHVIARDRELPEFLPDPTGGGIIYAGCPAVWTIQGKTLRLWSVRAKANSGLERRASFQRSLTPRYAAGPLASL
jgi:hypothetical protein